MKEIDSLHPDRLEDATARVAPQSDSVVDRWFVDHFHGPHHMRSLADPHGYVRDAADDLKRRLSTEQTGDST